MPDNAAPSTSSLDGIFPFQKVFEDECVLIKDSRLKRGVKTDQPTNDTLTGLAFSGGGIRSATFNLGLLQALARNQLLSSFDYLSTVSGGGYIGSWLATLTRRAGFDEVKKALECTPYAVGKPGEHPAVRWLRNYSDYLTPRVGFFTGDAGAVLGNWLRNVILNQLVLVLFLLGVTLLPFAFVLFTQSVIQSQESHAIAAFFVGVFLIVFATIVMAKCMVPADTYKERTAWWQRRVGLGVMLPLFVAAWLMNSGMLAWKDISDRTIRYWMLGGALFYFVVWVSGAVLANRRREKNAGGMDPMAKVVSSSILALAAAGAGLLGGALLNRYAFFAAPFARQSQGNLWTSIILGTMAVLLLMLFVAVLQLGFLGRDCLDLVREWWARVGGSLILMLMVWLLVFGIVIFGPLLVRLSLNTRFAREINFSAVVGWLASIVGGIGAGKSAHTVGGKTAQDTEGKGSFLDLLKSAYIKEVVAKVAPYVFIVGLLIVLATAVHYEAGLYFAAEKTRALWSIHLSSAEIWNCYWEIQSSAGWGCISVVALVLIGLAAGLSCRVDVNDFSMHHFYRNRLVRCYLGASRNQERKPQPFTGFDPDDEIALAALLQPGDGGSKSYPGLYPILNGTLNVTRGGELGFQKRKAKPFIFTPLYCGYDVNCYARTELGRSEKLGRNAGITLGTAMAISGAAVSPNMGFHTSPATAFFLTLFDVRLGWWMGNPHFPKKWISPGPIWGLAYLLAELLGTSDEKSGYVYLSDGAHFENLAIYELIKRRCRLIVVSDCGEDCGYVFEDLMSAIEKARTDFCVDIRIDVSNIRPVFPGRDSQASYAVAKIHYGQDDCGILIYLKASLPKDDPKASAENRTPADVLSYAQAHATFPHQSTGDQWFDEVQFESYRALGEYIGDLVVKDANLASKLSAVLSGQIKSCQDIDRAG